ncbi:MAG TPA: serine/threonine-protein kinase, partial [Gemmataceae bacterium]
MCTPSHLDELLRRWEDARRQGRPAAPEELCRDCPELLEPLRRGIAARERADAPPGETVAPGAPGPPPWPGEAGDAPGAEPVPGYRLVRRLGEGGFGEVWQAEGPGGFPVALKFIRPPGRVGEPELRALEITKRLRHPNLLAVFGAWQAGGRLVIAMELAERSLLDRLREVRAQGLSGIPRDELLEYMREAAKGVDFLNEPRVLFEGRRPVRVQHRDLKPHNILLVGGGVKVADFGLARLLEGAPPGRAVVLAPPYAAPEFFAGHTSRHSDQYSLAVTYCQLRGGRLPFEGAQAGV